MTTPAGWYPDPYDPAMLRYWDGETWTESVSPAGAPAQPPGGPPQLSGQPQPWAQHGDGLRGGQGFGYGDVGSWLSDTFTRLMERIVPMALLLFAIPVVGYAVAAGLGWLLLSDLTIDTTNDVDMTGFSAGLGLLIAVVFIATLIVHAVCWLAANHQMYAAHVGQPQPIGASLATGLRRLPRAIGWWLLFVIAFFAIFWLLFFGLVALIAADGGGAAVGLFFLAFLFLVPVMLWIGIRLAFMGIAIAVGPTGTNPLRASWNATRDRWWGTFGRLLLVGVILWVISLVFNFATSAVVGSVVTSALELDPVTGDVLIDGQPIDQLDTIDVGDLIPAIGSFVAVAVLYLLGQAVNQAISVSSLASLYARTDGPGEV